MVENPADVVVRCVLLLLSISNKDLLFFIIESYDCLVAGEAQLMRTQKHAHTCLRSAFAVVVFQISIFASVHT